MTVIATDSQQRLSNLIKRYDTPLDPYLHHEKVVANETAATTYQVGHVLGKVTATGKYKISVATASDGSQVAAGIYIGTGTLGNPENLAIAAATDTNILILARGKAVVSQGALVFDASVNTTPLRTTKYAELAALQIFAEITI